MPNFVAPIILLLAASYAFYTTKELWNLDEYKLRQKGATWLSAEDVVDLRKAVNTGQLTPQDAEHLMNAKYPFGIHGPPALTEEQGNAMAQYAVERKRAMDAQSL